MLRLDIPAAAWSDDSERRLAISLLLAAVVVAGVLALVRLPTGSAYLPRLEVIVRLIEPESPPASETVPEDESAQISRPGAGVQAGATAAAAVPVARPYADTPQPERRRQTIDWQQQMEQAVSDVVDEFDRAYSVNPRFDSKRREAAVRFRPSRMERKRPIWENVEKDTLGRTVLWHKNCYRVLDDPNVGSRETFLMFTQYLASCVYRSEPYVEPQWVAEIRGRYAYLGEPDLPVAQ